MFTTVKKPQTGGTSKITSPVIYRMTRGHGKPLRTTTLPGMELMVEFIMKGESVYVVRMPPYTISDLENLKMKIANNKLVKIHNIGMTVEKGLSR